MAHADARSFPDADVKRRSVLAAYGLFPDGPDSVPAAEVPDAAGDSPSASAARALNFLVDLAAKLCGVPFSVVNIITPEQQVQLAAAGLQPGLCAREDSMCAKVFQQGLTTVVPDAAADPRFADNPFVTGEIARVRFYASAPLRTGSGFALGSLCVFSDAPARISAEQIAMLDVLAGQVVEVLDLQHRTLQLQQAVAELERSNRKLAEFEFGLTAAVECDDADVLADPVQLRTLLQNLLGNSYNYRRPGEDLRIRVSGLADERGVTVRVADNGKGIAAAERERVLEPLVRLHRPGDAPGSGLGLATCVRIVSSHGGELSITDTPGGGTTVSALFPEDGQDDFA